MRDQLHEIVEEFAATPKELRLALLLEFSKSLPALPAHLEENRDAMEPVEECTAPVFLSVDAAPDQPVRIYIDAPAEAPTTRGFASILIEGLDGASPDEVLSTPNDFSAGMGLDELVSPLRMRGLSGMLARIKRQVAEAAAA